MTTVWPQNHQVAVSLTYDDALPVHSDHVVDIHGKNQSRATFYTNIGDNFMRRHEAWRNVAAAGHELGNHSIFHPCKKTKGMSWPDDCFDLNTYDSTRFLRELEVANFILKLTDGKTKRSYGNTCCHTTFGTGAQETSMTPILKRLFSAARGPLNDRIIIPAEKPDFYELGHFSGDGKTFPELKALIEQAMTAGGWIVFMFHGVGKGTHSLFIEKNEHDALLRWIGENSRTIWSRPLAEVAGHLKNISAPDTLPLPSTEHPAG